MTDYVADLKRFVPIAGGRAVEAIRFQVLGNIKDHIRIVLRDFEVRPDGTAIITLTAEQALALAKEFTKQADLAKRRII